MPAPKRPRRVLVTNLRDQPVELHLLTGVVVLDPHGQIELDEPAPGTDQLAALAQQELLALTSAAPDAADQPARTGRRTAAAAAKPRSTGAKPAGAKKKNPSPPKSPEGGS